MCRKSRVELGVWGGCGALITCQELCGFSRKMNRGLKGLGIISPLVPGGFSSPTEEIAGRSSDNKNPALRTWQKSNGEGGLSHR